MNDKTATASLALVLGLTMLTCLCYTAILVVPENPLNPYPPSHATARAEAIFLANNPAPAIVPDTPAAEGTSIFQATWTPTITPIPSETPTPTETRTPTSTATETSTSTPFPSPTPTETATPLPPTFTPFPTSTPPPMFRVSSQRGEPNCLVLRIKGRVLDSSNLPLQGVTLQVGELNIPNSAFNVVTDANGRYIFDFGGPGEESKTWFVLPLSNGSPAGERFTWQTDANVKLRTGDGDNGETLEPGQAEYTCDLDDSVQIMEVDWRRRSEP